MQKIFKYWWKKTVNLTTWRPAWLSKIEIFRKRKLILRINLGNFARKIRIKCLNFGKIKINQWIKSHKFQ